VSAATRLLVELREVIDRAAKGHAFELPRCLLDHLVDRHACDLWDLIEDFSARKWTVGRKEGRVEGITAARDRLLALAGVKFSQGLDDEAKQARASARALDEVLVEAESSARSARTEFESDY
jgi:hypothetical protein